MERKFHGAKVPQLSFPGVNGFGSEKTSYPSDTGYRGDGTISRVSPQVLYVHHETRENLLSQISQRFLSCWISWISIVKQTPTNSLFFVKMSCLFTGILRAHNVTVLTAPPMRLPIPNPNPNPNPKTHPIFNPTRTLFRKKTKTTPEYRSA